MARHFGSNSSPCFLIAWFEIQVPYHVWKETRQQQPVEQFIIDAINQQLHAMGIEKEFPKPNQ